MKRLAWRGASSKITWRQTMRFYSGLVTEEAARLPW